MAYVFTRREFEKLKGVVDSIQRNLNAATKTKGEAGGEQDAWHDEVHKMGLVDEMTWSKRMREMQEIFLDATIVDPVEQDDKIMIGNGVEIRYRDDGSFFRFTLEGYLIDPCPNKVSMSSPLGLIVFGLSVGDVREAILPGGKKKIVITRIVCPSQADDFIGAGPDGSVAVNLISIDGPDGSGKSTLAKLMSSEIGRKSFLIKPSYFDSSDYAKQIGEEWQAVRDVLNPRSATHNDFFLRAMRANYEHEVWPAVKNGRTVILDSSEIRALAFLIDNADGEAIADNRDKIRSGELTFRLRPKFRIFINSKPEVLLKNLQTKAVLDYGDPRDISGVERRLAAYQMAIEFIKELDIDHQEQWINLSFPHLENNYREYLLEVIRFEILPLIDF